MSRAPTPTQRALLDAVAAGMKPLQAVPPMPLSVWAVKHFKLSAESSHTTGDWTAYPFQPGWMDAFSNDDIEEVTVRKAKRVGYTKTLLAFMAYNAVHRRRKQALWLPTDDDRDSFVKSEIEPMLRDVKVLRAVHQAGKEDTIKLKSFFGSVMHLLGGKAQRAYRRITVAVAMLDEASAFDEKIEKSVDPITAARGRLEGAPFPKLIAGSTVRFKGVDHIDYREQNADARMRYCIVCPHCEVEHPLLWGGKALAHGFKWDGADVSTVRHLCPHCRGAITQADYLRIWDQGAAWVSECGAWRYDHHAHQWLDAAGQPCRPPRHVAFCELWTAYSPQRDWSDIVREFLEATAKANAGEDGPLQTFINETLAQYWEIKLDRADEHALAKRAADGPYYRLRTVPQGGLVLVAGVDVQDDRWEVVVWAIGRGEEMWAVDYHVIHGNPADERDWTEKLDPYLADTVFQHACGRAMKIEAAAVDTGGHFTHQAYNFCRLRERRRIFAVRGDPMPSKMVKGKATIQDVNWRGKILKRGVRLWYVGTDTAKDLVYGRLMVDRPGAGYVHFSRDLPDAFYHQLTAEARMPVKTVRGVEYRWVNPKRARNEVLDCTVYAIFCTHQLGLHVYTAAQWDRLASVYEPDLFSAPAIAVDAAASLPPAPSPAAVPVAAPPVAGAAPFASQPARRRTGRISPWSSH
jgi:phage terminase large subunit GpA-like protein